MRSSVPTNVFAFLSNVQHRELSLGRNHVGWSAARAVFSNRTGADLHAGPHCSTVARPACLPLRSLAARARVTQSLLGAPLPGPPCCFVVAVRGASTGVCAPSPRMRYNNAAHTDAREARRLLSPSQSRPVIRGRKPATITV